MSHQFLSSVVISNGLVQSGAFSAIATGDLPDLSGIYQPLDSDLTALAANSSNGIWARTGSGTGSVRTITGTTNRLSVTNGDGVSGNPTLDIHTSYVGQNTITTLGTVATGVWNATAIGAAYGGTGQDSSGSTGVAFVSAGTWSFVSTTGSGNFVRATSPTLVTPTLGVASATTINKVTITAPATGSTLTIDDGFTLHASGNANISGTNTGDQTITLTGNVTGSGTGSFATTIGAGVVTNAMLAGSIIASKLVGTDIVTVGTLTTGATGTGFTVALGASTITGVLGVTNGGTGTATALTAGSLVIAGVSGVYTNSTHLNWDETNTRLNVGDTTTSYVSSVSTGTSAGVETYCVGATLTSYGYAVFKRGTTGNSAAAVASTTQLGFNSFYGWDGSAYGLGSYFQATATENWSGSAHGCSFSIFTTSNTTTTNVVRFFIANNGNISCSNFVSANSSGTPLAPVHSNGVIFSDNGNSFATTKLDTQGNAWSTRLTDSGLVLQGSASSRPEIAWYRGSRTNPQAALRESTTNDDGLEVWTGAGTASPTICAAFHPLAKVGIGIGTTAPSGALHITPSATGTVTLFLQEIASQTADQIQHRDSSTNLLGGVDVNGQPYIQSVNGAKWLQGSSTELITLSTSGTTTDSTTNLLPAGAIIKSVVARVITTITTATDWKLGDPTTAARFAIANATMTAGATSIGLNHQQGSVTTDAAGPVQTTAAKVRITTTGTPGAGVVRVTVFFETFIAPTS